MPFLCCMHFVMFSSIADEIKNYFERFGPLTVDWPHKAQTKAYFPPKGEVFKCVNWLFVVYTHVYVA